MPDNLHPSPHTFSNAAPNPLPSPFPPPWASAFGDDEYGLWLEFCVGDACQRLRWIAPGWFVMGPPEAETERIQAITQSYKDWLQKEHPQHRVFISQGFWLADTACNQALWQAVMGQNPAHFHAGSQGSPAHPVENVSWDDVQGFLQKLNNHLGLGQASLPTEAEWEYACRAGTTVPFWFGETISPDQVNYDGNYPYGNGKKGKNREQTVAVKALPPNGWGLYQMHGNVWEWCADDLRNYWAEPVRDPGLAAALALPTEPQSEGRAVLRGGSWISAAHGVRAASRDASGCRLRRDFIGFRLALRFPDSKAF